MSKNTLLNGKRSIADAIGVDTIDEDGNDLYSLPDDVEDELNTLGLEQAKKALKDLHQARNQLKDLPEITSRKAFLDKLAKNAEEKFEDIYELALETEPKFMARIIEVATQLLKVALDAHNKIIDSDLKIIDMQMKKEKIEMDMNSKQNSSTGMKQIDNSSGYSSRNDLLDD